MSKNTPIKLILAITLCMDCNQINFIGVFLPITPIKFILSQYYNLFPIKLFDRCVLSHHAHKIYFIKQIQLYYKLIYLLWLLINCLLNKVYCIHSSPDTLLTTTLWSFCYSSLDYHYWPDYQSFPFCYCYHFPSVLLSFFYLMFCYFQHCCHCARHSSSASPFPL